MTTSERTWQRSSCPFATFTPIGFGMTLFLALGLLHLAAQSVSGQSARETHTSIRTQPRLIPEELSPPPEPILNEQALLITKPIGQLRVEIQPEADPRGELTLPPDYAAELVAQYPTIHYAAAPPMPRTGRPAVLDSAEFCHLPLYFEDIKLERYGRSYGIFQPAFSAAHFFGTVPVLPYKMVVEPPRQCLAYQYPFEAGRHAPPFRNRYPIRADAALVQAGVVIGLIAILP